LHLFDLAAVTAPVPALPTGLSFEDLYDHEGLRRVDALFLQHLEEVEPDLHAALLRAREGRDVLPAKQESELLLGLAPHLDEFVGWLFGIQEEVQSLPLGITSSIRCTA
jgi:hypothetical protein